MIPACEGLLRYSLMRDFAAKGYTWRRSGADHRFNGAWWSLMGKVLTTDGKLVVRHAYIGDGLLEHAEFDAKRDSDGRVWHASIGRSLT